MTTPLRTRVRQRAASLLVGTAVASVAIAAPAAAQDVAAGHYIVDTDRAYVFHVGTGVADVLATHFQNDSRLQSQVIGTVYNLGSAGCEFVRVIWHYGDGTASASASPRACANDHDWVPIDLHSGHSKDVYRADVQLRRAAAPDRPGALEDVAVRYVADGLTGRHLDHDIADWWNGRSPIFRSRIEYRLSDNCVATLSGRLTRAMAVARVVVVWRYQDGTYSQSAAWVYRGNSMRVGSSAARDIRSITTQITTYDAAGGPRGTVIRTSHLGDYDLA